MIAPIFDGREVGTAATADVDVSNAQFLQSGNGFFIHAEADFLNDDGDA